MCELTLQACVGGGWWTTINRPCVLDEGNARTLLCPRTHCPRHHPDAPTYSFCLDIFWDLRRSKGERNFHGNCVHWRLGRPNLLNTQTHRERVDFSSRLFTFLIVCSSVPAKILVTLSVFCSSS
ncbi:hypothetical protein ILYODFUR_001449 [Ilyodon furcidens]|uniref:Uncharacterized protein n=1 Tax=Ilyodon furcidens TaxID=33524 RepID=A0ABV0T4Q6_9TELE